MLRVDDAPVMPLSGRITNSTKTFHHANTIIILITSSGCLSHACIKTEYLARSRFFCRVMVRLRVGILFGGKSKEREVSFAGGRTVFDVLDRRWFEPVPLFLDSRNHLYLLKWSYLYSGSIRDFYPPPSHQPSDVPLYDDFLPSDRVFTEVGQPLAWEQLSRHVDVVFLVLHGAYGEDGTVQGWLDWLEIPYTGSGILPSALGVHKGLQKEWLAPRGFYFHPYLRIHRRDWKEDPSTHLQKARTALRFPVVVKPATQGSSIGVQWVAQPEHLDANTIEKAFLCESLSTDEWHQWGIAQKKQWIRRLADIQDGIGFPVWVDQHMFRTPEDLFAFLDGQPHNEQIWLEGRHFETEVIIEEAVKGQEFTCIIIEDEKGRPVPLPPSEVRKNFEVFDYRAKYLPGIVRKRTPMDQSPQALHRIMEECRRLYEATGFETYARIDGFYLSGGNIYLNDPNTTSGMLPSSFLFHQGAEVGLGPTDIVSWIIFSSLRIQQNARPHGRRARKYFQYLHQAFTQASQHPDSHPMRVAVIFGGCSTERHISVESGRNVVEKLAAHPKFEPIPVFLHCGPNDEMIFHRVPLKLLMKDNADDIRESIEHFSVSETSQATFQRLEGVRRLLGKEDYVSHPQPISLEDFPRMFDFVFIAVHGHPGEDGILQAKLEQLQMPFNGSNAEVAHRTMNKYKTNQWLANRGFLVPKHYLVERTAWLSDPDQTIEHLEAILGDYPYIAKPVDEGCSSAVLPIKSREDLRRYAEGVFRANATLPVSIRRHFHLRENAPFPAKDAFLVEEKVGLANAKKLIEITGGVLACPTKEGEIRYEALPPSEVIAGEGILSLEEKFLAGEGVNITPARFSSDPQSNRAIERKVRRTLEAVAKAAGIEGYCRIDAFVRIFTEQEPEVIIIEINSLPGLTPATVLFHQGALAGYQPAQLLETIIDNGIRFHAQR